MEIKQLSYYINEVKIIKSEKHNKKGILLFYERNERNEYIIIK